jgi:hypothetical protein
MVATQLFQAQVSLLLHQLAVVAVLAQVVQVQVVVQVVVDKAKLLLKQVELGLQDKVMQVAQEQQQVVAEVELLL